MTEFKLIIFFTILVNLIFYLNLEFFAKKINVFDSPDGKRKIHKIKVPTIGGIIFIFNILFFLFLYHFFSLSLNNIHLEYLILVLLAIFVLGFYDDKFDLNSNLKLVLFMIIITIYFFLDKNQTIQQLRFSTFNENIQLNNYSLIFTVLSVVIFINAFNLYDGINGQSGLYSIIIYLFLIYKNHLILLSIVIITCLVFFLYNNFKNKIFLGDGGSLTISFLFSILIINYYQKSNIFVCEEIFILMMIPGLDMMRLFIQRILKNKNPLKADNNHLHHLLLKKYSLNKTIAINFFLMIIPILLMIFGVNHLIIIVFFSLLYLIIFYKLSYKKFGN